MLTKNSASLTIKDFIQELEKQSKNPPGEDVVIKFCYLAFLKALKEERVKKYFIDIINKRKFTSSHFVNLLFRAIQYIELFQIKNVRYPTNYTTLDAWEKEIAYIKNVHGQLLSDLLLKRDTTTTVYQRYAGAKIVLNTLFPNKILAIADFGCGGNYGLPGLELNLEFQQIIDHTEYISKLSLLTKPLHIVEGLAVDKEFPKDPSAKEWRLACSFYPHELNKKTETLIFEAETEQAKNVQFAQCDLTQLSNIDNSLFKNSFDAVIMSTFLYQLSSSNQDGVIALAQKILKKNGTLIIQDFAQKDKANSKKLTMVNDWFSQPYTYKAFICGGVTNWEMREILQWKNGRCKEVQKGTDFDWFIQFAKQI